jgi:hypothetical protein
MRSVAGIGTSFRYYVNLRSFSYQFSFELPIRPSMQHAVGHRDSRSTVKDSIGKTGIFHWSCRLCQAWIVFRDTFVLAPFHGPPLRMYAACK